MRFLSGVREKPCQQRRFERGENERLDANLKRLENLRNVRRCRLLSLVVVGITACSMTLNASNAGNSKTATFKGTPEQVFNTVVKVAQLNWQVTFLDRETKILSFNEMSAPAEIACSVVVEDLQDGSVRVTLGVQGRNVVTTMEWGDDTAKLFFRGIQDELAKQAKASH